jgi:SAM-dependent methyltransferase
MSKFDDPAFFGEVFADIYDDDPVNDPTPAVDFLVDLAGGGRTLELAIGTGRVALPLRARGVPVEGVEASDRMVARMRAKADGDQIPVTIGDMADVAVAGQFKLVYLIYNTLFNLLESDRQAACFRNVAKILEPDGAFVIECYIPDPAWYGDGQRVDVLSVTENSALIEVYQFDRNGQRFISQRINFDGSGRVTLRPHAERYCWPNELDLMATNAGLHLAERYEDWDRSPFGPDSTDHISVYRMAP